MHQSLFPGSDRMLAGFTLGRRLLLACREDCDLAKSLAPSFAVPGLTDSVLMRLLTLVTHAVAGKKARISLLRLRCMLMTALIILQPDAGVRDIEPFEKERVYALWLLLVRCDPSGLWVSESPKSAAELTDDARILADIAGFHAGFMCLLPYFDLRSGRIATGMRFLKKHNAGPVSRAFVLMGKDSKKNTDAEAWKSSGLVLASVMTELPRTGSDCGNNHENERKGTPALELTPECTAMLTNAAMKAAAQGFPAAALAVEAARMEELRVTGFTAIKEVKHPRKESSPQSANSEKPAPVLYVLGRAVHLPEGTASDIIAMLSEAFLQIEHESSVATSAACDFYFDGPNAVADKRAFRGIFVPLDYLYLPRLWWFEMLTACGVIVQPPEEIAALLRMQGVPEGCVLRPSRITHQMMQGIVLRCGAPAASLLEAKADSITDLFHQRDSERLAFELNRLSTAMAPELDENTTADTHLTVPARLKSLTEPFLTPATLMWVKNEIDASLAAPLSKLTVGDVLMDWIANNRTKHPAALMGELTNGLAGELADTAEQRASAPREGAA